MNQRSPASRTASATAPLAASTSTANRDYRLVGCDHIKIDPYRA